MSWQTIELLLNLSFSVAVVRGALRSPHPVIAKAEHDGSLYLAALFRVFHWGGVLAIVAALWFASPHLRDGIWACVVILWIYSTSWYRRREQG